MTLFESADPASKEFVVCLGRDLGDLYSAGRQARNQSVPTRGTSDVCFVHIFVYSFCIRRLLFFVI